MNRQQLQKADAIIVLGRVDQHGHLTIDGHERIRYAAELYAQGLAPIVVAPARWWYKLTYTPPETEAGIIKARLVEHGVPENAILCEEQSCDTLGAPYFLKTDFVQPRGWQNVIVITSEDHVKRTEYVFHKVFGDSLELQYTWGKRVLSDRQYKASLEREAKSLKLMEDTWVGPVTPGDHAHFEKIFAQHPGYNPNATIDAAEIERRVQSQQVVA
jgi:uncharacterized SAM-binding protein YcdF (DUF218 family)